MRQEKYTKYKKLHSSSKNVTTNECSIYAFMPKVFDSNKQVKLHHLSTSINTMKRIESYSNNISIFKTSIFANNFAQDSI